MLTPAPAPSFPWRRDRAAGLAPEDVHLRVVYELLRALCSRTHMPLSIGLAAFDAAAALRAQAPPLAREFLESAFARLRTLARSSDHLVRQGDGTFLLVMPDTPLGDAVRTLDKLRQAVRRKPFRLAGGETVAPTLSAGAAEVALAEPDSLQKAGEQAFRQLALARTQGGDRVLPEGTGREVQENLVLLAEEDLLLVPLISSRFQQEGFEVRHACDGAKALTLATLHPARLVILDAHLTHMNGYELLGRLRQMPAYRRTPIVMLSAMSSAKDVSRGLSLGASDFLAKPFSMTELMARTQRLLKGVPA